jgi:hypothetical protein
MGLVGFEFIDALSNTSEFVMNNSKPVRDEGKEVAKNGGNPSYNCEKDDRSILIGVVGASI